MAASGVSTSHCLPQKEALFLKHQFSTVPKIIKDRPHESIKNAFRARSILTSQTSDQGASGESPQPHAPSNVPKQHVNVLPASHTRAKSPADIAFSHITVLMIMVYGLMLFAPRLGLTRRIIRSPVLIGLMAATCALSTAAACQAGLLSSLSSILCAWCSSLVPDFALLSPLFNSPTITLMAWVHLLMLDFYVAREVFADAAAHSIPAAHSLVLCFFVGPIGLLCHTLTRTLVLKWRRQ